MADRVLVLGGGAREHALAWKLAQSPRVAEVFCAPGNAGTAAVATNVACDIHDNAAVVALADELDVDLVVVGTDQPAVNGVVDALEAAGHLAFGPSAAAAQLEGSKIWMKAVVTRAGVPTARYAEFTIGQEAEAFAHLDTMTGGYVIKTDGLAAGKGVIVTDSLPEAQQAVRDYLSGAAFGAAGERLVIEEMMTGPEVSLFVLCDGNGGAIPLAPAQDHKRVGEGDTGPNTGGMGAYSPVPFVDDALVDEVMAKIVHPTLDTLAAEGTPFRGILFTGLMLTPEGPKLVEYNVRFGDPECQVVLPRMTSDLYVHYREAAEGCLASEVTFADDAAVTVCLACAGYPGAPTTGDPITGLDAAAAVPGVTLFHAGTKAEGDALVTAGGRVLSVTATGPTIDAACARAYEAVGHISWPGLHYRRDIAYQAREENL